MRDEKRLLLLLVTVVGIIFLLTTALVWSLQWSKLAIITLLFCISYPLIWFAWQTYNFWCQSLQQITSYTQMLRNGENNVRFTSQHPKSLLCDLQKEITLLAQTNKIQAEYSINSVLKDILDTWTLPICLFDNQQKLLYRNQAMNEQLQQPMILGNDAKSLGFTFEQDMISNASFTENWQCQTVHLTHQSKSYYFFAAINSTALLNQKQSITQQNLIRVLSHELRNSLTPMSSMTETLLSKETLEELKTRQVLTRINQRSKKLLDFISEYNQLAQLPKPQPKWHDFQDIIDDATTIISEKNANVHFIGARQCYGDATQIAQVLINLIKNSYEANTDQFTEINISLYIENKQQYLEFSDNGPGFANLNNVLTPFYTTKRNGSGIGLSLCAEIVHNHHGKIEVNNMTSGGAKVTISWPINQK